MSIHNLTNLVPSGSTRTGTYKLDPESEQVLDQFVSWLLSKGYKTSTSNSYRSYLAKAQYLGQTWKDMSSDQRSALRKFSEFLD